MTRIGFPLAWVRLSYRADHVADAETAAHGDVVGGLDDRAVQHGVTHGDGSGQARGGRRPLSRRAGRPELRVCRTRVDIREPAFESG
jgi:hypothetical protein